MGTVTSLTMGREAKEWERRVRKHFDLLLDHGFAFGGVDDSSFWETGAIYHGGRVGIEIDLIRLRNGRLPEPQVWPTSPSTAPCSTT
jgi:hypothetical protein